jgi:hypothetical protein
MSSGAPSTSLRGLFSELEQLFQNETQARVSTSVQAAERALAEHLNQSARRLRQAATFAEAAAILCDASARFADVCAVFSVDGSAVTGEHARGADGDIHELRLDTAEAAAFAAILQSGEPLVAMASAAEVSPAVADFFKHTPESKAFLFPITVAKTTVGVLYAVGTVESAALELMTQAAAASLELRQRPARRAIAAVDSGLVRIEAAADAPSATSSEWNALTPADRKLHLRAQSFARVEVAEMRLYQSDAVKAGRAREDLYAALQDTIDEARETFRRDFLMASPTMVDYLHLELLRTLANDNPAWLGANYPGPLSIHGGT